MISLKFNAEAFAEELEREFASEVEGGVLEMTKRVAKHIRSGAEERSPRGTRARRGKSGKGQGPLHRSWVVAVGQPRSLRSGFAEGSDQQADQELAGLRLENPVFVQSTSFKSGFFEHGTVKMPPRPIVAPLIEETKEFVG